jgi:acetyltransferase-like isoleucine patch superfamily enzyme
VLFFGRGEHMDKNQSVTEKVKERSVFSQIIRVLFYPLTHHLSLLKTLYFNFRYFPAHVAVRLPVFIYRGVRLESTKGWIELDMQVVTTGCIGIGKKSYGFQTGQQKTIWEQRGGTVIFGNRVKIGKGSFISVGRFGMLRLGNQVHFGGNMKLICNKSITIRDHTMIAWDVQIIDTDFHRTVNTIFRTNNCVEKPIEIGKHNWLGFGSTILKGTVTPDYCIVAAKTILKEDFSEAGENIILGHDQGAKVIARYIQFDDKHLVESSEWEEIDNLVNLRNKRRAM